MDVKMVRPEVGGPFGVTTERTGIPQSEKLLRTIKNLCSVLEIEVVYFQKGNNNTTYYRPKGFGAYQSASNTILDLSERVAKKYSS